MYWKIEEAKPWYSKEKLVSGLVALIIIVTSVLGLISFIISKSFTEEFEAQ